MEVQQRVRIINDSIKLVDQSSKLDTRLSRCDLILEHAGALYEKYEQREIPSTNPSPSHFLQQYQAKREQVLLEGIRTLVDDTLKKAELSPGVKAKITQVTRALIRLQEYRAKLRDPSPLNEVELRLKEVVHRLRLDDYLETAKKAEFKGQPKKALDAYYDALYFLRHDEIEDRLQADHIGEVEAKIRELGGTPEG